MTLQGYFDRIEGAYRLTSRKGQAQGITVPPKRKEHNVTLTNHIKRMDELTIDIVRLVDCKDYPNAHLLLDELESKVNCVRRHIDHLQNVTDFCARPSGDSTI